MKNARFPTGKRFGSLEEAVLELVRRYDASFGRRIFASDKEARRAIAADLTHLPFKRGVIRTDACYQRHVGRCLRSPHHASILQRALLQKSSGSGGGGGGGGGSSGSSSSSGCESRGPIDEMGEDVFQVHLLCCLLACF